MSVYLDASVTVPLFTRDPLNDRAERVLRGLHKILIISDFSTAEFSSAIARRVRTRDLSPIEARTVFSNFDIWCARNTQFVEIESVDVMGANSLIRRLDLSLRAPDALHIAIAQRIGSILLTFDKSMADAAQILGLTIV